jgi:type II secretory pathway pseudopilin PulG
LELILALLVLTLAAGLILPRFSAALPGARLGKAAGDLHTVIQKVRADTAVFVKRHQLLIDTAGGRYWVLLEAEPMRDPGVFVPPEKGPLRREFTLPDDVTFSLVEGPPPAAAGGGFVFTFNPDGSVEPGRIVLSDPGGETRTLMMDGATGNVEVLQ